MVSSNPPCLRVWNYHHVVVRPRDLAEVSLLNWRQGGTFSPVINDPVTALPLHRTIDICRRAIGCI